MSRAIDTAKYEGHTKGPWLVSVGTVQLHVYAKDGIGTICSVGQPEYDKARPVGTKAERANAHLIADVTELLRQRNELLAVCQKLLRALESHLDESCRDHGLGHRDMLCPCNQNEVVEARAAITSAKGEEDKR